MREFLDPFTNWLFNRYYIGGWAVQSSLFVSQRAQTLINAASRQADASVSLHINPAFAQA